MNKAMIIPLFVVALLGAGSIVLAQTDQVIPTPIGAHEVPNTPAAMASPSTMPGGLYRLGKRFLICPDTLYLMSGQPNLRVCTYVKDVH